MNVSLASDLPRIRWLDARFSAPLFGTASTNGTWATKVALEQPGHMCWTEAEEGRQGLVYPFGSGPSQLSTLTWVPPGPWAAEAHYDRTAGLFGDRGSLRLQILDLEAAPLT